MDTSEHTEHLGGHLGYHYQLSLPSPANLTSPLGQTEISELKPFSMRHLYMNVNGYSRMWSLFSVCACDLQACTIVTVLHCSLLVENMQTARFILCEYYLFGCRVSMLDIL